MSLVKLAAKSVKDGDYEETLPYSTATRNLALVGAGLSAARAIKSGRAAWKVHKGIVEGTRRLNRSTQLEQQFGGKAPGKEELAETIAKLKQHRRTLVLGAGLAGLGDLGAGALAWREHKRKKEHDRRLNKAGRKRS